MKKRLWYAGVFVLLLGVECLIALYVRDRFIRPYVGDMLVTVLLYFFVRMIRFTSSLLLSALFAMYTTPSCAREFPFCLPHAPFPVRRSKSKTFRVGGSFTSVPHSQIYFYSLLPAPCLCHVPCCGNPRIKELDCCTSCRYIHTSLTMPGADAAAPTGHGGRCGLAYESRASCNAGTHNYFLS